MPWAKVTVKENIEGGSYDVPGFERESGGVHVGTAEQVSHASHPAERYKQLSKMM
jgi:hypothetical protein